MITTISHHDIKNSLSELGIAKNSTLFIHSFLGAFGKLNATFDDILDSFIDSSGLNSTLIFPTYNYDFCRGSIYDHDNSPSQVGQLTEHVRKSSRAVRSFHPVYSHAVLGSKRDFYSNSPSPSAFGKNSFFARLIEDDAFLVLFGVSWNTITFIHYVEEFLGVPYRFLKIFSGQVIENGSQFNYAAEIFSRYLELNLILDLSRLKDLCFSRGIARKVVLGRGEITLVPCREFLKAAEELYSKDIFTFLKSPVDLKLIGSHI